MSAGKADQNNIPPDNMRTGLTGLIELKEHCNNIPLEKDKEHYIKLGILHSSWIFKRAYFCLRYDKEERARYNFWHNRPLNPIPAEVSPGHSPASGDQKGIRTTTTARAEPISAQIPATGNRTKVVRMNGTYGIVPHTSDGSKRIQQLEADLKAEQMKASELRREYRKFFNMHGRNMSDTTRTMKELIKYS